MAADPDPAATRHLDPTPVDRFLAHLRNERRLSPRTLEAYGTDLADFSAWANSQPVETWPAR